MVCFGIIESIDIVYQKWKTGNNAQWYYGGNAQWHCILNDKKMVTFKVLYDSSCDSHSQINMVN